MAATTLLSAVTGAGAGTIKKSAYPMQHHALSITITGSPTTIVVDLEGSVDGTNFVALGTKTFSAGEKTAAFALLFVIDKPVTYVQANVTTLSGGSSPTVTALHEGDKSPFNKVSRTGEF